MQALCEKTLPCGHRCMGYTNEPVCPPCLDFKCVAGSLPKKDDDCPICFTEPLSAAPIIMVSHIVPRKLTLKLVGGRLW